MTPDEDLLTCKLKLTLTEVADLARRPGAKGLSTSDAIRAALGFPPLPKPVVRPLGRPPLSEEERARRAELQSAERRQRALERECRSEAKKLRRELEALLAKYPHEGIRSLDYRADVATLERLIREADAPLWRTPIGRRALVRKEELQRLIGEDEARGGPPLPSFMRSAQPPKKGELYLSQTHASRPSHPHELVTKK